MRKDGIRRVLAVLLAGNMALCGAFPAFAVGDGVDLICDEAYYATTDYYGNLTAGSVVKSYVLNGKTELTDFGVYDEVVNLTDDTTPEIRDGKLTFRLNEAQSHFYFEGKTSEPFETLPWKLSIRYMLNGVPVRAEELAGKSGTVELQIDAIPNEKASEYARHNYVLAANAAFNQDDILSLEAPGAQMQLIGNLRVALFLCLPGEEEHFTLRVGTDSFRFSGMTFLLMPATLSQLDQISELSRKKDDIEDNYHKLSGSLDELLDALNVVSGNLRGSAGGLDALNDARGTISEGKDEVYDRADVLREDLDRINAALEPTMADLENASAALTDGNETLRELTGKTAELRRELDRLKTLLEDTRKRKKDVVEVFDSLADLAEELHDLSRRLNRTTFQRIELRSDLTARVKEGMNTVSGSYSQINSVYSEYSGTHSLDTFLAAVLKINGSSLSAETLKGIAAKYSGKSLDEAEDAAVAAYFAAYPPVDPPSPTEEEKAAAAAAVAPEVTAYGTYLAIANAYQTYLASNTTLANFLSALAYLADVSGDTSRAAELQEMAVLVENNPYAFDALQEEAGGILRETVGLDNTINSEIGSINSTIGTLNSLMDPTADVVEALDDLVDDLYALKPLINTTDDLLALGAESTEKLHGILDSVAALQGVLDTYEPKAQTALQTVGSAVNTTRETLTHLGEFSDSLGDLGKTAGEQLDEATRKSLANLAASLRSTAAALDKNNGVRNAKETITDIVEDLWDEHTGEVDNLLMMDVDAELQSLTSEQNPAPQSIQLLIRTQEIEQPEEDTEESAAQPEKMTFLGRIVQMFRDFWAAITGLFH